MFVVLPGRGGSGPGEMLMICSSDCDCNLDSKLDSRLPKLPKLPNCSSSFDYNNFAYFLRLQIAGNMLVNVPLSDCLDRPLPLPPHSTRSPSVEFKNQEVTQQQQAHRTAKRRWKIWLGYLLLKCCSAKSKSKPRAEAASELKLTLKL